MQILLENVSFQNFQKSQVFSPGRSTEQSTVAYDRPSQLTDWSTDLVAWGVHVVHVCRSTDRSTANPCGRPFGRTTSSPLASVESG